MRYYRYFVNRFKVGPYYTVVGSDHGVYFVAVQEYSVLSAGVHCADSTVQYSTGVQCANSTGVHCADTAGLFTKYHISSF